MLAFRKESKKMVRLMLCLPSTGDWKADFGISLTQMCVYMSSTLFEHAEEREIVVNDKRTSMIATSREECLQDAVARECTHALFIDCDQAFPPDTAHQLMRWRKPVVAANIAVKAIPSFPNSRAKGPTPFGVPVTTDPWKRGLEQVWRVGTGIMLIDCAILPKLGHGLFGSPWIAEVGRYQGEDWTFCQKCEEAGIPIFVDHDLSRSVTHVGNFAYGHQHIPLIENAPAAMEKAA